MSETTTTDKSQGQEALERLLAVRNRYTAIASGLKATLVAIGSPVKGTPASGHAGASSGAETSSGRSEARFFPALHTLTEELDRTASDLEASAAELAKRF